MPDFIYLASQSPRRSQLLDQIGVPHRLLVPNAPGDVAEDTEALEQVLPGEAPAAYVERVTALKLDAAVQRLARRGLAPAPILCSDTTVALDGRIFGKPETADDARSMLARLAGREHRVLTAVAVQAGAQRFAALSVSQVRLGTLSPAQIDAYIATGEPMGKAGAYGIQGAAAAFIAHMSGSYSGIMGLPLYETACLLRSAGFSF
ncbi:MAG: Maf family nucleotide pyrophosphatase [Burkholderiales bacterium]|nr:Maf family nucleotide pyrophosphatase [Burkholderiales bacterium]